MKNKKISFKSEKGLSLVEVLLSVALLAIIAGPLLGAVTASVWNNVTAKDKTEAVALAEMVMEEIKAQGGIGETNPDNILGKDFVQYTGVTSGKLEAYYEIVNIDKTTSGGIVVPSPDSTYTYTDEIDAANQADFELEIDQANISNGTVDVTFYTVVNANTKTKVKSIPGVKVIGDILKLKLIKDGSDYKYFFDYKTVHETTSNTVTFTPKDNIIRLRVTYKNTVSGSAKLKIYTYCYDANLYIYEENIVEANSGVKFIPKGTENFFIYYMDTQNVFNYKSPINGLYKITVFIKKENSSQNIYEMTSYVKK